MVYIFFCCIGPHTDDRIPIVQIVNHPKTECRRYGRCGSDFYIKIFYRSPLFHVLFAIHTYSPLFILFLLPLLKWIDHHQTIRIPVVASPYSHSTRLLLLLLLLLPYSPFFTLTVWLSFMFYGLWSNDGSWLWDYVTQLQNAWCISECKRLRYKPKFRENHRKKKIAENSEGHSMYVGSVRNSLGLRPY